MLNTPTSLVQDNVFYPKRTMLFPGLKYLGVGCATYYMLGLR